MRWEHLKAVLWMRWRLGMNRSKRAGRISQVVAFVVAAILAIASVSALFVSFLIGLMATREAEPDHLLLVFDVLVVAFLFFWIVSLVTELQRSESVSLDRLLHLPISLSGTFVLNYLTSLVSPALFLFLSITTGLGLALVVVKGPAMLLTFPLLLSFVLMVTAVTYQFRGWLATLMTNKRRARTIVAMIMLGFMLLAQAPQLVNLVFYRHHNQIRQQERHERDALVALLQAGEIDQEEYQRREQARAERQTRQKEAKSEQFVDAVVLANALIPVGWLPYGVRSAAGGAFLAPLLGSLGACVIGVLSLSRSYRATLRFYTGGYQPGKRRAMPNPAATRVETSPTTRTCFLEKRLGVVSEHAATVALATFRSLTRAPEAKMMLLTPIIILLIFGVTLSSGSARVVPELLRPLIAVFAVGMTMFGLVQLTHNQFGLDRNGFRVYVLAPVPRRDILLGKNLAVAPLGFAMCLIILLILQFVVPMQIGHLLATVVQIGSIYIVFCMVGNLASILAPTAVKPGGMKAASPTILVVLLQMLAMMLFPLGLLPTLITLGVDLAMEAASWRGVVPVYLLLSIPQLALMAWIYKYVLVAQGRLLQRREQRILEVVTARAE